MASKQVRFTMWRADKAEMKPIEVECPHGLFPHDDADGVKIYENTHFKTRAECIASLRKDAEISVKWAGEDVTRCQKALSEAYEKAGKAAQRFAAISELE